MSKDKTPPAKDVKQPPKVTPESEAKERIKMLQDSVKALQGEIRTLSGRLANRDPVLIASLQADNKVLRERLGRMEKALAGLLTESLAPKQQDDIKLQLEVLRLATVEYCKKANITPELWKSIES